jgi:hypothetical protein
MTHTKSRIIFNGEAAGRRCAAGADRQHSD